MIRSKFLHECFAYNDWARERLLRASGGLSDAALDRPFEMGEGTLRATLYHLWAAEYGWLNRWQPRDNPPYSADCRGEPLAEIARRFAETAAERNAFLATLDDQGLQRRITYTNSKGITSTFSLGQMMLHVCNHGMHHRAQALNMLRHLGAETPKPGLDYVFMRLELGAEKAPALDIASLRAFYEYADWARAKTHAAAGPLRDDQLDRPFDVGWGSLRATLNHIRLAEQWWFHNWTAGPGDLFPLTAQRLPIAEITRLFDEFRQQRNAYFDGLIDADLLRPMTAQPRPGVRLTFPLGVTMLQLCFHGTHHRAQALNMLRHVGAQVPALDYAQMLREVQRPA